MLLIGPLGVGKSTIAAKLANSLQKPRCCFDEVKFDYLSEAGFDLKTAHDIRDAKGIFAMWLYANRFSIEVLERVVAEHPGHIIDLGAGSHCFEEPEEIERAQAVFNSIETSILLMPSPDLATSIRALPGVQEQRYMNTFFIMHPLNEAFARQTVYTIGKTPDETATEIEAGSLST